MRKKVEPPAVALPGFRLVKVGAGLLMENVVSGESPPPGDGVFTAMRNEPTLAISAAVN